MASLVSACPARRLDTDWRNICTSHAAHAVTSSLPQDRRCRLRQAQRFVEFPAGSIRRPRFEFHTAKITSDAGCIEAPVPPVSFHPSGPSSLIPLMKLLGRFLKLRYFGNPAF